MLSGGNRRRLVHITKRRSSMLRFLLVEPAQVTVRSMPEWRSQYFRLMLRRGRKTAKVSMVSGSPISDTRSRLVSGNINQGRKGDLP